jgi:hypothetical protein
MKRISKLLVLIGVLTVVFPTKFYAQSKSNDTTVCLQIIGVAISKTEPVNGVTVRLFKENEELMWEEVSVIPYHEHSFTFSLLGNSNYSIEVSKEGYISRLVSINTTLPDDVVIKGNKFVFEFEVELQKNIKANDDFYLDFPIAIISYNSTSGVFENHDDYTKHIKEKIIMGIKGEASVRKEQ